MSLPHCIIFWHTPLCDRADLFYALLSPCASRSIDLLAEAVLATLNSCLCLESRHLRLALSPPLARACVALLPSIGDRAYEFAMMIIVKLLNAGVLLEAFASDHAYHLALLHFIDEAVTRCEFVRVSERQWSFELHQDPSLPLVVSAADLARLVNFLKRIRVEDLFARSEGEEECRDTQLDRVQLVVRLLGTLCEKDTGRGASDSAPCVSDIVGPLGMIEWCASALESLKHVQPVQQRFATNADETVTAETGLKGALVRLIGNAAYRHNANQLCALDCGAVALILAHTTVDETSPFVREWALLSIRNLCEGNTNVQSFIAQLEKRSPAENEALRSMGVEAEFDADGKLHLKKQ